MKSDLDNSVSSNDIVHRFLEHQYTTVKLCVKLRLSSGIKLFYGVNFGKITNGHRFRCAIL